VPYIQHLLDGCTVLAPSSYLLHHDMVACALHRHLYFVFRQLAPTSWHSYYSLPVIKNQQVKILWDFSIYCILKISSPADIDILDREEEKVIKYQPLARKMRLLYKLTVDITTVVFGVTDAALKSQKNYMRKILSCSEENSFALRNSGNDIHPSGILIYDYLMLITYDYLLYTYGIFILILYMCTCEI